MGKVTRLHGYKGELSLKLDYDLPYEYEALEAVYVEQNGKLVPFFISSMKFTPKGYALTFFDEVDSEDRAKRLIGADLFLPEADLPEMAEDEYLKHELVGFQVTDNIHGDLGQVEAVLDYPGNTMLRIDNEHGEVLIPLIDEFIEQVDKSAKSIVVNTPEGLIDLNF